MPDVAQLPHGESYASAAKASANGGRGAETADSPAVSMFPRCGNPACATGWLHLWRNRRVPAFEGRWACSPACMRALVALALRREKSAGGVSGGWSHRIPIGLLLVEQGRITAAQLRDALEGWRNRDAEKGDRMRLGAWMVESGLLTEPALTRGLSAQWNCAAFSLAHYRPEETASVMPRILVEAFGAVPVRAAAGRVDLAFCGAIDRSLSYAVERATGWRVTAGIAGDRAFRRAQGQYLETPGPRMRCIEAADPLSLARAIAEQIEREKPVEARLVRVHRDIWLRLWRSLAPEPGLAGRSDVEDVLCVQQGSGPESDYRDSCSRR